MAIVTVPAENRRLTEPAEITAFLAAHGLLYDRWPLEDRVDPAAPADTILAAYAPEIDELKRRGGFVHSPAAGSSRPRRPAPQIPQRTHPQ